MAKLRQEEVVLLHGVLYYWGSLLGEPRAQGGRRPTSTTRTRCPRTQGGRAGRERAVRDVRWLWPTITKEMVEAVFAQCGTVIDVVIESPTWGAKTGDPLCERYGMRYDLRVRVRHLFGQGQRGRGSAGDAGLHLHRGRRAD